MLFKTLKFKNKKRLKLNKKKTEKLNTFHLI